MGEADPYCDRREGRSKVNYDNYVIARSVEAIPRRKSRLLRKVCSEFIEGCARNDMQVSAVGEELRLRTLLRSLLKSYWR